MKDKIKQARTEANLTQKELAEQIGVKQPHIARYENGEREPKLKTLLLIAEATGKSINYFIEEEKMKKYEFGNGRLINNIEKVKELMVQSQAEESTTDGVIIKLQGDWYKSDGAGHYDSDKGSYTSVELNEYDEDDEFLNGEIIGYIETFYSYQEGN